MNLVLFCHDFAYGLCHYIHYIFSSKSLERVILPLFSIFSSRYIEEKKQRQRTHTTTVFFSISPVCFYSYSFTISLATFLMYPQDKRQRLTSSLASFYVCLNDKGWADIFYQTSARRLSWNDNFYFYIFFFLFFRFLEIFIINFFSFRTEFRFWGKINFLNFLKQNAYFLPKVYLIF